MKPAYRNAAILSDFKLVLRLGRKAPWTKLSPYLLIRDKTDRVRVVTVVVGRSLRLCCEERNKKWSGK